MSTIYTSARVTTVANVRRVYRLPQGYMPKVIVGQTVRPMDTLAVALEARDHRIIDVAGALGVPPEKVESYLVRQVDDTVERGEELALRRTLLGLRRRRVVAPIEGRVAHIEHGELLLEGVPVRMEVQATVPGKVIEQVPERYVLVETTGAAIQVAWGHGSLAWGTLKVMDTAPSLTTNAERFNIDHRGAVVAIGSPLTEEFLRGAVQIRVKGLIAASMRASLLPMLEEVEFPVALTQGFGTFEMSERILNLLNTYNGRDVALDMGTPGDWRNRRPEIIIPLASQSQQKVSAETGRGELEVRAGQKVRVLQPPYLGQIGVVTDVPHDARRLESGLWANGVLVEMPSGATVFVPFANFEYLG